MSRIIRFVNGPRAGDTLYVSTAPPEVIVHEEPPLQAVMGPLSGENPSPVAVAPRTGRYERLGNSMEYEWKGWG